MANKILVTNDDESIIVEIASIPDPDDDFEDIRYARCRSCTWNSFLEADSETALRADEVDAINDAESHLDTHERVSES